MPLNMTRLRFDGNMGRMRRIPVYLLGLLLFAATGHAAEPDPSLDRVVAALEALESDPDGNLLTELRRRAEGDDVQAQYWLGRYLHDIAPFAARDHAAGRGWLERASEAGHLPATELLARIHETGFAVAADRERATVLYARALELGSTTAGYDLARLEFAKGEDGRDGTTILEYLGVAADRGNLAATVDLAFLLASGRYADADHQRALELAEVAIAAGNGRAMNLMARMYARGLGVEADAVEALKWALLARRHGDPAAGELVDEIAAALPETGHEQAHARASAWLEDRSRQE